MKAMIVCGSREYSDRQTIWNALDRHKPDVVIHGDAAGADRLAGEWADSRGVACIPMPAPWHRMGKSAGSYRNRQMLLALLAIKECGYEVSVLAFPLASSIGTRDMMRLADAERVTVLS